MHTTTHYAADPSDFKSYGTERIRNSFLLNNLFADDEIVTHYSHYDRLIVGGVKPVTKPLHLESLEILKADYFLQRREIGIINVGCEGAISVDGKKYTLQYKDALYVGKDSKEVIFHNVPGKAALYYFNSAPSHAVYPTRRIILEEAETVELGSLGTSNHRTIRKLIVNSIVPTCQLQMGLTELKVGSVWNTMPPHTHDRRMEAYFYFEISEGNAVCHFMGQPDETRHIWLKNNEAIISPPWSIHSGAGTSNYSFIWGMAGENLDYNDMDKILPTELK